MNLLPLTDTLLSLGLNTQEVEKVLTATTNRQVKEAIATSVGGAYPSARLSKARKPRSKPRYQPYLVPAPIATPQLSTLAPAAWRSTAHSVEGGATALASADAFNAALLEKVRSSEAPSPASSDGWDGKPRLSDPRYRLK